MPVLNNAQTGEAESLSPEQAASALASGTHHVPLYSPEGEAVSVPASEASALLQKGYSQPTEAENKAAIEQVKYSTPLEKVKTLAEGAVSGATLGFGTALLPSDKAAMRKRAEINPYTQMAGEAAGLVGGALLTGGASAEAAGLKGISAAGAMEAAGTAGAKALGLSAETALGRVGTAAAKAGIENMAFEGGHEVSKYFMGNPDSIETAAAHIGMAGLLGAGLGATARGASELWKLGPGAKLAEALEGFKRNAEGSSGELAKTAGVQLSPEVEAGVAGNAKAQEVAADLASGETIAAKSFQEKVAKDVSKLDEALPQALNKTTEELHALRNVRESEAGEAAAETIHSKISNEYKPIHKEYEALDATARKVELTTEDKQALSDKIVKLATDTGVFKAPGSEGATMINRVLKEISMQETALDLKNYLKSLPDEWKVSYITKPIRAAFNEVKNGAIERHLGASAPEELLRFKETSKAYGALMEKIDALSSKLRIGSSGGVKEFLAKLGNAKAEKILNGLSTKGDAAFGDFLSQNFPELVNVSKDVELSKLIRSSYKGEQFSGRKFIEKLEQLKPEHRDFVVAPEAQKQLGAIKELYTKLEGLGKTSFSGKIADELGKKYGNTALAMAVGAFTHSGVAGALSVLGKIGLKEGADGARLALLKFLSSAERTNAEGFVAAAKLADATVKGEKALNASVSSVFSPGEKNVIKFPDAASRDALKEQVDAVLQEPGKLLEMGGQAGHYAPEHGAAIGAMATRNLQYLASLKPNLDPLGPLDKPRVASKDEEAKYNRALDIAQQPLIIVDAIKDGSLTLQDIKHIKTMYPELSNRISEKLTAELIKHQSEDKVLKYKTKIALSAWAGQPLDSSMSQQAISANQFTYMSMPAPQAAKGTPAKASSALNKIGSANMTLQQSRSNYRTTGHR